MKLHLPIIAAVVLAAAAAGVSQDVMHSVWEGAYTADQAKRGQVLYGKNCAPCHGETLDGSEAGPTLVGHEFMLTWNGKTANDLLNLIDKTMPKDQPGRLSHAEDADVIAFILSSNQFPAGTSELPHDSEPLKQIRLDEKKPN